MLLRRGAAIHLAIVAVLASAPAACGGREDAPERSGSAAVSPVPATAAVPVPFGPRIVILGDSLTAGLGVGIDEAFPAVLQRRLSAAGFKNAIVNAGVSGDTSAGGLSRLDDALRGDVRVLVVALGGNDGLRGLPPEELQRNLAEVIEHAQARQITVVLAGMEAPPNFGADYTKAFRQVYPDLARKYHIALVPFLLQGVTQRPHDMLLSDQAAEILRPPFARKYLIGHVLMNEWRA